MTLAAAPADPPQSRRAEGYLCALLAVGIFGATLPATSAALADFDPGFITFARAGLATIVAAATLIAAKTPIPREPGLWLRLGAIGVLLAYGFPGFIALAMRTAPAAEGGVALAILPLASAGFAALLGVGRASLRLWLANLVGGALVLSFLYRDGVDGVGWGHGYLLIAGLATSLGYVMTSQLTTRLGGWPVIAWALLAIAPISAIGMIATWPDAATLQGAAIGSWGALAFLGLGSMFLAFVVFNRAIRLIGVLRTTQTQLMQVFVTIALAGLLLGEPIGVEVFGYALAVAAVVWVGRRG